MLFFYFLEFEVAWPHQALNNLSFPNTKVWPFPWWDQYFDVNQCPLQNFLQFVLSSVPYNKLLLSSSTYYFQGHKSNIFYWSHPRQDHMICYHVAFILLKILLVFVQAFCLKCLMCLLCRLRAIEKRLGFGITWLKNVCIINSLNQIFNRLLILTFNYLIHYHINEK